MSKKRTTRTREQVVRSVITKINIDAESGCWLWQAGRSSQYQYPYVWSQGTAVAVHKLLYEYIHGELPKTAADGTRIELHHDRDAGCRGRSSGCVNPHHMQVLSARQHGQVTALERKLGLTEPRPPRRSRKKPPQSTSSIDAAATEHHSPA